MAYAGLWSLLSLVDDVRCIDASDGRCGIGVCVVGGGVFFVNDAVEGARFGRGVATSIIEYR